MAHLLRVLCRARREHQAQLAPQLLVQRSFVVGRRRRPAAARGRPPQQRAQVDPEEHARVRRHVRQRERIERVAEVRAARGEPERVRFEVTVDEPRVVEQRSHHRLDRPGHAREDAGVAQSAARSGAERVRARRGVKIAARRAAREFPHAMRVVSRR